MRIRIRDLREDRDVKQCDLAEAIGINQQTISNYETGKTIPDAFVLIKIADFFGVSIDYLLGRVDMDLYNEKRRTALIENIQRELEELKLMKYPQPLETKQSIWYSKTIPSFLTNFHYKDICKITVHAENLGMDGGFLLIIEIIHSMIAEKLFYKKCKFLLTKFEK